MLTLLRESSLGSTLRKFQVTAHLEKMATHGKVEMEKATERNGPEVAWAELHFALASPPTG